MRAEHVLAIIGGTILEVALLTLAATVGGWLERRRWPRAEPPWEFVVGGGPAPPCDDPDCPLCHGGPHA